MDANATANIAKAMQVFTPLQKWFVFFVFYRTKLIVLLNIIALIGLLLFVALLQPILLIEAFNPVTTNITLIGLSLILLTEIHKK